MSPEAHDAYLRGHYFYDRRETGKSVAAYQEAIRLEPAYSSAYAGYAVALDSQGMFVAGIPEGLLAQARATAQKAIALDPENGEAYLALGIVETTIGWDWGAAEKNLKRGLELNPGNAVGRMWHAIYLEVMGHTEEGVTEMRRALDDDPLSFFLTRQYATVLYFARRYDESLVQLERAHEMHPDRPSLTEHWVSWNYEAKGMFREAMVHNLLNGDERHELNVPGLKDAFAGGDWKGYWEERVRETKPATWAGCDFYMGGVGYVRVGEYDKAFAALNKAADAHCFWMSEINVDPKLDVVRGDKRFGELVRKVGLPGGE